MKRDGTLEKLSIWWTDLRACPYQFEGIPVGEWVMMYPACRKNRWHRGPHLSTVEPAP